MRRRNFLALTAATTVGALVPLRAAAAAATGDAEIVLVANGLPYRAIRAAGGVVGDYQKLDLGTNTYPLNAAVVNGQEFIEYADNWVNKHAVRQPDGTYAITDSAITDSAPLGVAGVNGELHVIGANPLWHAIRHADGTWSGEGYIESETGSVGFQAYAAVAGDGGRLHVVVVTLNGGIVHTKREADGSWAAFGDVNAVAGQIGTTNEVATAVVNGELHLAALVQDGSVHHTIRHANGTWSRFGNVQQAVPGILGVVGRIGSGAVNGELFLLCGQQNGMGLTGVGLVIRHADGTWSGPDDVNTPSINPSGIAGFSAMSVSAL